jgi:hypothetical protein
MLNGSRPLGPEGYPGTSGTASGVFLQVAMLAITIPTIRNLQARPGRALVVEY